MEVHGEVSAGFEVQTDIWYGGTTAPYRFFTYWKIDDELFHLYLWGRLSDFGSMVRDDS